MELVETLNLPQIPKQRIPVKAIVEQLQLSGSDKKLLETHISSIHLISLLNEQTAKIRSYVDENYSFQAIYVFEIVLKQNDSITLLSQLIHSAFPESTLLFMKNNNVNYISGASKRINKLDPNKTVIEELVYAEYVNSLSNEFKNVSGFNLKEYYTNIINYIYKLKIYKIVNFFPQGNHDYREMIKQYDSLNADVNRLKEEYKNARMKAEKLRIDDELYDKELELKNLIKRLKGAK